MRGETNDVVEGDYVGVAISGETALGNGGYGVNLYNTTDSTIGGTVAGAADVVAASTLSGVLITGTSTGNVVEGDDIGTDAGGTQTGFGNGIDGVYILGAASNTIGGTSAAAANIISGNTNDGVEIAYGANDNVVEGDLIGTELGGETALPNQFDGVEIDNSSSGNTIGGLTTTPGSGAGDLISGNFNAGVDIFNSSNNVVEGDLIGTDAAGEVGLANFKGVLIYATSTGNTIGGNTADARNVIAGNTGPGVYVYTFYSTPPSNNLIAGNWIGLDVVTIVGTPTPVAVANGGEGVLLYSAGANTLSGNVISGNVDDGIAVLSSPGQSIVGNFIGTDPTGTQAIANTQDGINLGSSADVTITGNVISGNALSGVDISARPSSRSMTSLRGTRSARTPPGRRRWTTGLKAWPSATGPASRSAAPRPRPRT